VLTKEIQNNIIRLLQNCQFRELCDRYFAENFYWEIKGISLLSGIYRDKKQFFTQVISRLQKVVSKDWAMHIRNTYIPISLKDANKGE
jgi:hypothetical protein